MEGVCKFNQKGFCKFGDICRKHHVKEICSSSNCNTASCKLRHPRNCKFFTLFGSCKFNEDCAFKHTLSKSHIEIKDLQDQFHILKNSITEMNQVISHLKKELESYKSERKIECEYQTSKAKTLEDHTCGICGYKASSATVLKSHTTRKHKPKVLRDNDVNNSIPISVISDSKNEEVNEVSEYEHENDTTDISWKVALNNLSSDTLTCDECDARFPDEDELYDEHIWFKHRSNECQLKYQGCETKPSNDPHLISLWYMSCAYCWTKHLYRCPDILDMCPRKRSGFKAINF